MLDRCINLASDEAKEWLKFSTKEEMYRAYLANNYALPDYKSWAQESIKIEDVKKLTTLISSMLDTSGMAIEPMNNLRSLANVSDTAVAAFFKDVFYFSDNVTVQAVVEEAFHGVVQRVLSPEENFVIKSYGKALLQARLSQDEIDAAIAKLMQSYKGMSKEKALDYLSEEESAKEFVFYYTEKRFASEARYINELSNKLKPLFGNASYYLASIVNKVFKSLRAMNIWSKSNKSKAEAIFKGIESGKYKRSNKGVSNTYGNAPSFQSYPFQEGAYLDSVTSTRLVNNVFLTFTKDRETEIAEQLRKDKVSELEGAELSSETPMLTLPSLIRGTLQRFVDAKGNQLRKDIASHKQTKQLIEDAKAEVSKRTASMRAGKALTESQILKDSKVVALKSKVNILQDEERRQLAALSQNKREYLAMAYSQEKIILDVIKKINNKVSTSIENVLDEQIELSEAVSRDFTYGKAPNEIDPRKGSKVVKAFISKLSKFDKEFGIYESLDPDTVFNKLLYALKNKNSQKKQLEALLNYAKLQKKGSDIYIFATQFVKNVFGSDTTVINVSSKLKGAKSMKSFMSKYPNANTASMNLVLSSISKSQRLMVAIAEDRDTSFDYFEKEAVNNQMSIWQSNYAQVITNLKNTSNQELVKFRKDKKIDSSYLEDFKNTSNQKLNAFRNTIALVSFDNTNDSNLILSTNLYINFLKDYGIDISYNTAVELINNTYNKLNPNPNFPQTDLDISALEDGLFSGLVIEDKFGNIYESQYSKSLEVNDLPSGTKVAYMIRELARINAIYDERYQNGSVTDLEGKMRYEFQLPTATLKRHEEIKAGEYKVKNTLTQGLEALANPAMSKNQIDVVDVAGLFGENRRTTSSMNGKDYFGLQIRMLLQELRLVKSKQDENTFDILVPVNYGIYETSKVNDVVRLPFATHKKVDGVYKFTGAALIKPDGKLTGHGLSVVKNTIGNEAVSIVEGKKRILDMLLAKNQASFKLLNIDAENTPEYNTLPNGTYQISEKDMYEFYGYEQDVYSGFNTGELEFTDGVIKVTKGFKELNFSNANNLFNGEFLNGLLESNDAIEFINEKVNLIQDIVNQEVKENQKLLEENKDLIPKSFLEKGFVPSARTGVRYTLDAGNSNDQDNVLMAFGLDGTKSLGSVDMFAKKLDPMADAYHILNNLFLFNKFYATQYGQLQIGDLRRGLDSSSAKVYQRLKTKNGALDSASTDYDNKQAFLFGNQKDVTFITMPDPSTVSDIVLDGTRSELTAADGQSHMGTTGARKLAFKMKRMKAIETIDKVEEGYLLGEKDLAEMNNNDASTKTEKTLVSDGEVVHKMSQALTMTKRNTSIPTVISKEEFDLHADLIEVRPGFFKTLHKTKTSTQNAATQEVSYIDGKYYKWTPKKATPDMYKTRMSLDGWRLNADNVFEYKGNGVSSINGVLNYNNENDYTIDYMIHPSGSKTAKRNLLLDYNSLAKSPKDFFVSTLDTGYYGLQTENRPHDTILNATQKEGVVLANYSNSVEKTIPLAITDVLTGEKTPKMYSPLQLKKDYNSLINKIRQNQIIALKSLLLKGGELNINYLYEIVSNSIQDQTDQEQVLEFFKASADINGNIKLTSANISMIRTKMEYYHQSLLRNALAVETKGSSMALVSSKGFNVVKRGFVNEKTKEVQWEVIDESNLPEGINDLEDLSSQHYYNRGNKEVSELEKTIASRALASEKKEFYFIDRLRHHVPEYDSKGNKIGYFTEALMPIQKDMTSITEDNKYAYGLRIPFSDKGFAVNIKWVGTLPTEMANSIMTADEVIQIAGSDFDFDKLYVTFNNTYKSVENGKQVVKKADYSYESYKSYWYSTREFGISFKANKARLLKEQIGKEEGEVALELSRLKQLKLTERVDKLKGLLAKINKEASLEATKALKILSEEEYNAKTNSQKLDINPPLLKNRLLELDQQMLINEFTIKEKLYDSVTSPDQMKKVKAATISITANGLENFRDKLKEKYKIEGDTLYLFIDNSGKYIYDKVKSNTGAWSIANVVPYVDSRKIAKEGIDKIVATQQLLFFAANIDLQVQKEAGITIINEVRHDSFKSKDKDGTFTSKNTGLLVATTLDEIKEGYLDGFNISTDMLSVSAIMASLGSSLPDTFLFLNNPAILEYEKLKSEINGKKKRISFNEVKYTYSKLHELKALLKTKYDYNFVNTNDINISMEEILLGGDAVDAKSIAAYFKYEDMQKELLGKIAFTKVDSYPKKNAFRLDSIADSAKSLDKEEMISTNDGPKATSLFKWKTAKTNYKDLFEAQLESAKFLAGQKEILGRAFGLHSRLGKEFFKGLGFNFLTARQKENVYKQIESFLFIEALKDTDIYRTAQSITDSSIYRNNFVSSFQRLKNTKGIEVKYNIFDLIDVVNDDETGRPKVILYNANSDSQSQQRQFIDAFEELRNAPEDSPYRQLYDNIFGYFLSNNGGLFSGDNVYRLLSLEDFKSVQANLDSFQDKVNGYSLALKRLEETTNFKAKQEMREKKKYDEIFAMIKSFQDAFFSNPNNKSYMEAFNVQGNEIEQPEIYESGFDDFGMVAEVEEEYTNTIDREEPSIFKDLEVKPIKIEELDLEALNSGNQLINPVLDGFAYVVSNKDSMYNKDYVLIRDDNNVIASYTSSIRDNAKGIIYKKVSTDVQNGLALFIPHFTNENLGGNNTSSLNRRVSAIENESLSTVIAEIGNFNIVGLNQSYIDLLGIIKKDLESKKLEKIESSVALENIQRTNLNGKNAILAANEVATKIIDFVFNAQVKSGSEIQFNKDTKKEEVESLSGKLIEANNIITKEIERGNTTVPNLFMIAKQRVDKFLVVNPDMQEKAVLYFGWLEGRLSQLINPAGFIYKNYVSLMDEIAEDLKTNMGIDIEAPIIANKNRTLDDRLIALKSLMNSLKDGTDIDLQYIDIYTAFFRDSKKLNALYYNPTTVDFVQDIRQAEKNFILDAKKNVQASSIIKALNDGGVSKDIYDKFITQLNEC